MSEKPLVVVGHWKSFSPRCWVPRMSQHLRVAGDQKASWRLWVYCPPWVLVLWARQQPRALRGYKYHWWSLRIIPNTDLAHEGSEPRQLRLHHCSPAGRSCRGRTDGATYWKRKREKYLLLHFIGIKEDSFMAHQHTRSFCSTCFHTYRVSIQHLQLWHFSAIQ